MRSSTTLVSSMMLAMCAGTPPLVAQSSDFDGDGRDDLALGSPHDDEIGTNDGSLNVIYGRGSGLHEAGDQFFTTDTPGLAGDEEANHSFWSVVTGDFNGDGFSDLAGGSPYQTVDGITDAGVVNVIYGSEDGLSLQGDQFWHADVAGVRGDAEQSDYFGFSQAVGDFDGDGFDDLAIGVPYKRVGGVSMGGVHVLYGSRNGLTASGDQLFTQETAGIRDVGELGDGFGHALAAGDFDGDGRDDLAIGIPFEDIGAIINAGAVAVLYGSSNGLSASGDQFWHQDSPNINNTAEALDRFGYSLAAGDFDGDGRDDLAISVKDEDIDVIANAGGVAVLYGTGSGLTSSGDQFWHQDSAGVQDTAETGDQFGFWLEAGDFDGDGRDDLAIGIFLEDVGAVSSAGAVAILYGRSSGLSASGDQFLHQDVTGIDGVAEANDQFGWSLIVGDFNGDGRDDLAVSAPDDVGPNAAQGTVTVFYGSNSGLSVSGEQIWSQESPGIKGVGSASDQWGGEAIDL